jgi:DNA modification methylase
MAAPVEVPYPIRCAHTELVDVTQLVPHPRNPNRHTDSQIRMLGKIISHQGWRNPIVISARSGYITRGHGRLAAAIKMGWSHVPVDKQDYDSEAQEYQDLVADNRIAELADLDTESTLALLDEMGNDFDAELMGYDEEGLAELEALDAAFRDAEEPEVEEGEAPEPPEEPVSQPGDMWLLGRHKLLCGDSREAKDVKRLVGDRLMDAVITDPPYGVSYVGKTQDALTIENDGAEGLLELLATALGQAKSVCRKGATWYVWAPAGPQFLDFAVVLKDLGVWRQTLVWVKDAFVLGHSDYHYRHEVAFYGWVPDGEHVSTPDRKQDTVWEVARPKQSRLHPTMKPVELMARCLHNGTAKKAVVYEPFGGSGTTLIACEQLGRTCLAMEMDPRYCDVIAKRWSEASGKDPILMRGGNKGEKIAFA